MILCNAAKSKNKNYKYTHHTYFIYTLHMALYNLQIYRDTIENNPVDSWTPNFGSDKNDLL